MRMHPMPELQRFDDGLHRIRLADGRAAVAKRRRGAVEGFFAMEAHGLALLRDASGLRVPAVFAVDREGIVLEDLGSGQAMLADWVAGGRALAHQHGKPADRFGLDRDGWCGDSPQVNLPVEAGTAGEGHAFFALRRLLPQARRACEAGRLASGEMAAVESLCTKLHERIPVQPPVLLHGDLWTGNLHACADGGLALIDAAAVHHGWAEAELAMLTLFGEPPAVFFEAYQEAARIDAGWRARAPLYNLYHLLNHLNLFGAGYLGSVRGVLRQLA